MRSAAASILLAGFLALAGTASAADYWVDANTGSDGNPGTETDPFLTVTHAITAAGSDATIHVLPGTYDAALGEVFPLWLLSGQTLVGDPANLGGGVEPTKIVGLGPTMTSAGSFSSATLVMGPSTELSGLQIDGVGSTLNHAAVLVDGNLASVVQCTFLEEAYAGILLIDAQGTEVFDNQFESSSYGVYLIECPEAPRIENNVFAGPSIPINNTGNSTVAWVHGNNFQSASQVGIQLQGGDLSIQGNIFEAGAGTPYGSIRTMGPEAMPLVRSNTFLAAPAVFILYGDPDLGTSGSPGNNDFTGVPGVCIQHEGAADVSAIGNDWPGGSPTVGVDVVITGTGSVILFAVPVEATSVGRVKTAY